MNFNSSKLSKQQAPGLSLGNAQAATVDLGSAMSLEIVPGSYPQVTIISALSLESFMINPACYGEEITQRRGQMEVELITTPSQFPNR